MLLMTVDAASPVPVYRQIYERVARLVDDGTLTPGSRLPASRHLADTLGVNRSTVVRAYQELWALGYLESRPGSYSTVRQRVKTPSESEPGPERLIDWERAAARPARLVHRALESLAAERARPAERAVNFGTLDADRMLCPVDDFRRAVRQVLLADGRALLDYGDPAGYRPLRETIAQRLRVHGVTVSADEVLITNGSQHGIDLVLRLLAGPGTEVVVESPTYALAIPLFRLHGVTLREVAMRADGMDLDELERVLVRHRPALIYTMPNFQNPTGVTTSHGHRERLLALAEEHRVPILEDGFEEELKYFGKCVLPLKSMDAGGVVIYAGTFSKVVFPGLRIGWLAADRDCIERLLAISRFTVLSSNVVSQAAVQRFCAGGAYEDHLRRVHRAYRKRMAVLLAGLKRHLPSAGVRWTQPAGGYTLMLWVETSLSEPELDERLRRAGVLLAPGSSFFAERQREVTFRLSIANLTEDEIEEGCRRLGRVLAEAVDG
jgi:DNA-binding transcriptional MocR family regulator